MGPKPLGLGVQPLLKRFDGPAEVFGTGHVDLIARLQRFHIDLLKLSVFHFKQPLTAHLGFDDADAALGSLLDVIPRGDHVSVVIASSVWAEQTPARADGVHHGPAVAALQPPHAAVDGALDGKVEVEFADFFVRLDDVHVVEVKHINSPGVRFGQP